MNRFAHTWQYQALIRSGILLELALRIDKHYPEQPVNPSDKEWIEEKFSNKEMQMMNDEAELPVTRVALFTDRIEAAHELGSVFRIAQFLEGMGECRDARLFILLAGRSRVAFDRVNHLSGDRAALEVEPRQAEA
jgi:hypothetical protein